MTKQTSYSNQKVVQRFAEELAVEVDERITYCFDIPEERRLDLLEMSPLGGKFLKKLKPSYNSDHWKNHD